MIALKDTKNSHYAVYNSKFISILKLAKLFSNKIKLVKSRPGERFNSKIINSFRGIKINKYLSKSSIQDYVLRFKSSIWYNLNFGLEIQKTDLTKFKK